MRSRIAAAAAVALAALVLLSGCFTSRELSGIQRTIDRQNPNVELRRNFVLNAGSGTIHLLERGASLWKSDESLIARRYLSDIDRIKVGIYDVRTRNSDHRLTFDLPPREGWIPAIVVRGEGQSTAVHYREARGGVRDLLIVAGDDEQVVVVRMRGDLGRILLRALEDREEIIRRSGYVRSDRETSDG